MATRRTFLSLSLGSLLLPVFGCGGGKEKFPETVVIKDAEVTPQLVNSELVVGPNRFAVGVIGPDGKPVVDAKVHLTFYDLDVNPPAKKFDLDAVSRVPARDSGITEQVSHVHADGTRHVHINAGDDVGIYTAKVNFDKAGNWGVEIAVDADKPSIKTTLRPRFNVIAKADTPSIGSPAPRSRNRTIADVKDLSEIDSSANPSPDMHTTTIADAIAAGKPALVLFANPGFCETRFCGPELEIMRKLYPKYRSRVEFIHVEFYKNPGSPDRVPVDAVREWGLSTEPWFFVIDAKGLIRAKFEGPATLQELEEALQGL